ncbi:hypothetical protein ACLOJK_019878 [Asimina triloba]
MLKPSRAKAERTMTVLHDLKIADSLEQRSGAGAVPSCRYNHKLCRSHQCSSA